jgi:hypothetical protein
MPHVLYLLGIDSFHPEMALFHPAYSGTSICGVPCAAYRLYASAKPLDFFAPLRGDSVPLLRSGFPEALTLQKIAHFCFGNCFVPMKSFMDGH